MRKRLILIISVFLCFLKVFASEEVPPQPLFLEAEELVEDQNADEEQQTAEENKQTKEERTLTQMLFAYSLVTSSDEELKRHAESYGITSNYKDGLLKRYGITESEDEIKAYFEKTDCSGNGRMARNLVEKAILHQAGRIVKENGNLQELRISDFELGDDYGKCN